MPSRVKRTWLELVAEWACLPCILAAGVLYALVTWVPEAVHERNLMVGSFLVAGVGAGLVNLRKARRSLRVTGATCMVAGLATVVCIGFW